MKGWKRLSVFIILNAIAAIAFLIWQNAQLREELAGQDQKIASQSTAIDSVRSANIGALLAHLLEVVETELNSSESRTMSDHTIARIADLSNALQPYRISSADTLSVRRLSPERGILLLALCRLDIDRSTLQEIYAATSFTNADLRSANLEGAYLDGVDLRGAALEDATMIGTRLNNARLESANLWGANLKNAIMIKADLTRANMSWTTLDGADLHRAKLSGADLLSANARYARMDSCNIQWARLNNAVMHGADLSHSDLLAAVLIKTQLNNADLSYTELKRANVSKALLDHADLTGANLPRTVVDDYGWFGRLTEWEVNGREEISNSYSISPHPDMAGSFILETKE